MIVNYLKIIWVWRLEGFRIVIGLLEIQKLINIHGLLLDKFDVLIETALTFHDWGWLLYGLINHLHRFNFLLLMLVIPLIDIELARELIDEIFCWLGAITHKLRSRLTVQFSLVPAFGGFEQALAGL